MTLCWSCKVGLKEEGGKGRRGGLFEEGYLGVEVMWVREGIINILNIK
jgi:hypothetical protein